MPARAALVVLMLLALPAAVRADLTDAIARVKPSVVGIGTLQKTRSPPVSFRATGFVVADGLLVVTNAHVLPGTVDAERNETIVVITGQAGEPRAREAEPVAIDRDSDVAVLRLKGEALPALALGDSGRVREGQAVAFTGFPIGVVLGFHPVTHRGIVSSITPVAIPSAGGRSLDARVVRRLREGAFPVFQLDATAYPGNSGSPVYDPETGQVIGIVNMVFVKGTKEAALTNPSGITYAIPAERIRELLRDKGLVK